MLSKSMLLGKLIKLLVMSVIVTYLTVFSQQWTVPTHQTAQYDSQFVLVAGLPFYFLEDNLGISPTNALDISPLGMMTGVDIFHLNKFLVDWFCWFACLTIFVGFYAYLKNKPKPR